MDEESNRQTRRANDGFAVQGRSWWRGGASWPPPCRPATGHTAGSRPAAIRSYRAGPVCLNSQAVSDKWIACRSSCLRQRQRLVEVDLIWRESIKRGVRPSLVVEGQVAGQRSLGVADAVVGTQVDLFVFDRFPQPPDEGSTPKSRTVVKELGTPDRAWRLFAASSGYGTARRIRTHQSSLHRVSGTSCGRSARA